MRTLLLAGAAVALLSGSALAQEQGGNQNQNMNQQMQDMQEKHPNAARQRGSSDEQSAPQGQERSGPRDQDMNNPQGGVRNNTIMKENPSSRTGTENTGMREQGAVRGGAHLTPTKALPGKDKTRIRETVIESGRAPRLDNLNFRVRVGVAIPRSVRLVAVPEEIVSIYPEWNGFLYFVSGDEIIVVDPNSYEVVGVLEA